MNAFDIAVTTTKYTLENIIKIKGYIPLAGYYIPGGIGLYIQTFTATSLY